MRLLQVPLHALWLLHVVVEYHGIRRIIFGKARGTCEAKNRAVFLRDHLDSRRPMTHRDVHPMSNFLPE